MLDNRTVELLKCKILKEDIEWLQEADAGRFELFADNGAQIAPRNENKLRN